MKESLRSKLARVAERNDITLNREIVERLAQSFRSEQRYGGSELSSIFRLMAAIAEVLETRRGRGPMTRDFETFVAVTAAWNQVIRSLSPILDAQLVERMNSLDERFSSLSAEAKALEAVRPEQPADLPHQGLLGIRMSVDQGDPSAIDYVNRLAERQATLDGLRSRQDILSREMQELLDHFKRLEESGKTEAERQLGLTAGARKGRRS